jgi:hypothetical protein
MAKLIYSMLTSLDGYTEDEHGQFGWGAPEDAPGPRRAAQQANPNCAYLRFGRGSCPDDHTRRS